MHTAFYSRKVKYALAGLFLGTAALWFSSRFLLSTNFLPHWYCYVGNQRLLWTNVIADLVIGLSYVAISVTLLWLVRRMRSDLPYAQLFWAFGLFIVSCGVTHFTEVVTVALPQCMGSSARARAIFDWRQSRESAHGSRSIFRAWRRLPRKPQSIRHPVLKEFKGEGLTILLADDETPLRQAVAEILRASGYIVFEAHTAEEVASIAEHRVEKLDILLTDILMPGLRGPELARLVSQRHPEVRVVYMSGYAEDIPEVQVTPNSAFLQKPFRFATLLEQLKLVQRKP